MVDKKARREILVYAMLALAALLVSTFSMGYLTAMGVHSSEPVRLVWVIALAVLGYGGAGLLYWSLDRLTDIIKRELGRTKGETE